MRRKGSQLSQPHPSQRRIDDSFKVLSAASTPADISDLVNDCVRFIIYKSGKQLPFRRTDFQKALNGLSGKTLDRVLERVSDILKNVYGFKLILCDGGTKYFIVSNNLPCIDEDREGEEANYSQDHRKILLMLILLHIFMSSNTVTQASLHSFLGALHIDHQRKNELFGNVDEYINTVLVKQHYLNVVKDNISQDISYTWGARAEKEISKHELLKLACKVYKSSDPKLWATQYRDADNQHLEVDKLIQTADENLEDNEEIL